MTNSTISWKEVLTFLSPAGQRQLVEFIQRAREERGANWLEEIKAEFPTFCWIVELVADCSAEEAFDDLQQEYSTFPLWMVKGQLFQLHALLRSEIDKKR